MTNLAIARQLNKSGLCVCNNFLTERHRENLHADLNDIHLSGGFARAGTGRGADKTPGGDTRRDEVHWLNRETANRAQAHLWSRVDALKRSFNRTLFLGLLDFEGHYAIYPEGGFYARHLDRFRGTSGGRTVSFIIYLNQNWQAKDGGRLRVYRADGHTDIDPRGGTMVCFLSGESEHEVLLNHSARFSFSGWFSSSARE